MRLITYTLGTETKKILVDSTILKGEESPEWIIKLIHSENKLDITVISNEYEGLIYVLPVVQPIGNINGI